MLTLFRATRAAFPGTSRGMLKLRLAMLARGVRLTPRLHPLLAAPAGSAAGRLLKGRPEMLGALLWPYQCANWEARERLARIESHCAEIDRLGPPFDFDLEERLVLSDLGALHPDLRLVLDQPGWFMREGGLTLNLFVDSFRAFSLSFSLFRDEEGRLAAYIGGLQGRNTDGALDLYRDLTRALHGMRPRDFLIEAFRMLAREIGVQRILAVSEAARHHHHPYFMGGERTAQDYDQAWEERDGTRLDADTYELPLESARRDLEEIKAKKRAMYRRRYEFLDELQAQIARDLPGLAPVRFADS